MKPFTLVCVVTLFTAGLACAQQGTAAAGGQDTAALEQKVRDLEDRLVALEGQMRVLNAQAGQAQAATPAATSTETASPAPAPAESVAVASTPVSLGGAGGSAAKAMNPDISMIGDFVGVAGGNSIRPSPALEMHESELGVQAIIDPYARGDFFLSFGETGVNVEEGYITFTSLPGGVILKVGKMRADFGKVNTIHNHALSYIDRPLVTDNLVGGEDGIDDAGISLSRILPAPKNWFVEGTAQVLRGDSSDVFTASRRQDVSVVGHIRAYRDLSESTNIDLGVSYARGHNDAGLGSM